jgi:hypothetical protein
MIPAERTMQLIQSVTQVIRTLMLQDLLKKLQEDSSLPCDFAEGTLYLDPDIIDLTMIPPPVTPDEVSICGNWSHLQGDPVDCYPPIWLQFCSMAVDPPLTF